jgi:hypothetical protein
MSMTWGFISVALGSALAACMAALSEPAPPSLSEVTLKLVARTSPEKKINPDKTEIRRTP